MSMVSLTAAADWPRWRVRVAGWCPRLNGRRAMPDSSSRPPRASRRWRWGWWVLVLVGLAGAGLASVWLFLIFKKQSGQPNSAAFLAVAGFLAAAAQVVLAGLQLRQGSRPVSAEPLVPHEWRERKARDQLRRHLGRQDRLRRMDDPATSALALRVHPAIGLPQPPEPTAALRAQTYSRPGRRRRLLSRPRRGRPGGVQTLDRDLPTFVSRDRGPEITSWMREAREDGGFFVLVGDSSVGKTRLLYETARDVLPDFAVLAPDLGDGDLVNSIAGACFPLPKLIVWLDELQRFLDGPYLTPGSIPITAAAVRHLLDAPTPVVMLGAMWPEHATQLHATEPDPDTGGQRLRYPHAADILGGDRVRQETLASFSGTEREAAARLSSGDPRLAKALADQDYNVTEVLAGAPQLIARYEQASEEQQAVLNAAIDARRLGIQGPLTCTLLRAAARGYLSTLHPDDTWLDPALAELTRRDRLQDHATAPLIPVLNEEKSEILGNTVADYLMQHASRERHYTRVPASTWDALIGHIRDPADTVRLADSARYRLLYRYAIPLYRRAADAGDGAAALRLAGRLAERGDLDEAAQLLRDLDGAGDPWAAQELAGLLAKRGDLDELRAWADAGDGWAVEELAGRLAERGDLDELRARADAGDWWAASRLADLLAERGDLDELRARADADDFAAASLRLADLLAERGDLDGLRARADAGDFAASLRLPDLLIKQGRGEEAERLRRFGLNPDGSIACA